MTGPNDTANLRQANGQGRVPPHNLEAEEALLGAMLLSADAIATALEQLKPDHFYKPANSHIFEAITDAHTDGEKPDAVTVADILRQRGLLKQVGGPVKLFELISGTPATSNARRYTHIIKNHADLRRAIQIAGDIAEAAYSLNDDAATVATSALAAVQGLVDSTNNQLQIFDIEQLVEEHRNLLESRSEGEGMGLPTGYHDLDDRIGGMREGEMWLVAAESAVGKSAFVGNVARNVARAGGRVLVVSIEMARLELMDRLVAAEAMVPLSVLRDGTLSIPAWERTARAGDRLSSGQLFMMDDPDVTLEQIDVAVRRTGADLFIVDYAQILKMPGGAGNREREVAAISSGIKRLCRRYRKAGMVLTAINRNVAGRSDQRPVKADIRESGQFEYDANVILGLYRDELKNEETPDPGIMEVIVLKSRNSKAGTTRLRYDPDTQLISNP